MTKPLLLGIRLKRENQGL